MVRIQQDVPLWVVFDRLLAEGYAAEPPTSYKKQLRQQMQNEAMQNESFCHEVEREIEDEFSETPRLDEIEDFINEMPPTLEEILDRYEIRDRARRYAQFHKKTGEG